MFDYVTGSDTMDKGAGMKVCGWNIHNCNRDVMGGLSSTMEDALLGKSETDKELDWEKMNALMGQLFPKSDLDPLTTLSLCRKHDPMPTLATRMFF